MLFKDILRKTSVIFLHFPTFSSAQAKTRIFVYSYVKVRHCKIPLKLHYNLRNAKQYFVPAQNKNQ